LPVIPGADRVAFAAGGSLLLLSGGGKLRALDTTDWREKFTCDADQFCVSADPAGEFFAALDGGHCVVRSVRTQEPVGSVDFCYDRRVKLDDLCLSPDGRKIVVAAQHFMDLWNVGSHGPHQNVGSANGNYLSIAYSPREFSLVSSNDRDAFDVYHINLLNPHHQLNRAFGSVGCVRQLRYSPDGLLFAGASEDRAVYIWESKTDKLKATLIGHEEPVNCVAFSPNGKTLASGDDRGRVRLWDLESNHEVLVFRGHPKAVKDLAFSPDGKLLVTSTAHSPTGDGEIRLWPADNRIEGKR
jgi:WD40 repeat protein